MDVNKNSYTIGFATLMVIIVAALLSSAAIGLKPLQSKNIEQEKKQNILKSVGIELSRELAEKDYSNYIKEELVLNHLGEIQEGSAFNVDLSKELRKDAKDQSLPLYIAQINGEERYIIPLRGKGLWGPIWGFISARIPVSILWRILAGRVTYCLYDGLCNRAPRRPGRAKLRGPRENPWN